MYLCKMNVEVEKIDIRQFSKDELENMFAELGEQRFRARQVYEWLWQKGAQNFEEMTNLSKKARSLLASKFSVGMRQPVDVQVSADGTKKYLFHGTSGKFIETAYIPERDRATVCLSSQVGCKMGCLFCMTGKQGFQGNLSAGEILNQYRSIPEWQSLTNIVYMEIGRASCRERV